MNRLSIDEIQRLLPDVEELSPLLDRLLGASEPDAERTWSEAGELGTVGQRIVDPASLERLIPLVLADVRRHLSRLYREVAAATVAAAEGDHRRAMDGLLASAGVEREAGRTKEAEAFVEAALRLAERLPERREALPAYLEGARLARALGRWEAAERRYREAVRLADAAGDRPSAATAWIGLGNLAVDRGLWTVARERYDRAEPRVLGLPEGAPARWHLSLNRVIVAREEGRLEDAEALLETARERAAGDPDAPPILENARGQLLRARGRLDESEFSFRRALEAATGPDARVTVAVNLAETLLAAGRSLEAGELMREAEALAVTAGVVRRLPEVYRVLGSVAAARGLEDAFVFFERALEVVDGRDLPAFERALVLEAYGEYDIGRGEEEVGRGRLAEAEAIYQRLGCRAAAERVTARLETDTHATNIENDEGK